MKLIANLLALGIICLLTYLCCLLSEYFFNKRRLNKSGTNKTDRTAKASDNS